MSKTAQIPPTTALVTRSEVRLDVFNYHYPAIAKNVCIIAITYNNAVMVTDTDDITHRCKLSDLTNL